MSATHDLDHTVPTHRPRAGAGRAGLVALALFGPSVFGVTSAAVALPNAAVALGVRPEAATWVLTVHALFLGAGAAVAGRLADALGSRRVLLLATTLLLLGTGVVLLSTSLPAVVAGRAALAAGSGSAVAVALSVNAGVPAPHRARALGRFGMGIAVFAASATVVGGLAVALSWRVALVLPVLSLAGVPACPPLGARPRSGRFDASGAVAVVVAAGSLIVLVQARSLRLPTGAVLMVAALVALSVVAAVLGRRRAGRSGVEPFVPTELIHGGTVRAMAALGACTYAGFFATVLLVPRELAAHGWSALGVGLVLLPASLLGATVSRLVAGGSGAGRSAHRRSLVALTLVELGFAAVAASILVVGQTTPLLVGVAAFGFAAFAVTQVVTTAVVGGTVVPQHRGAVLGVVNLAFFVGGSAGAAGAAAMATSLGSAGTLAATGALPLLAACAARRLVRNEHAG